jgi:hypothetical protein
LPIEREDSREGLIVLRNRKLIACGDCGWVHYTMTAEEKLTLDRGLSRYNLTPTEQYLYESAYRQCLRCEAPVGGFRDAREQDLARANVHTITPVLMDNS